MVKKTIGHALVTAHIITEQQLIECQKKAAQTGVSLEQCIVENNFATAHEIARAYAHSAALPYVEAVTDKMADLDLLAKVPFKFLRDNIVMPVIIDDALVILTANPANFEPLDELKLLLGSDVTYGVAPYPVIIEGINRYYPIEGTKQMIEELEEQEQELQAVSFEQIDEKDIANMATEAPIIKLVNHILFQAVKRSASDVHIEPFEKEIKVRYRIDGVMYDVMTPPKRIQSALISRIKIMAQLDIAQKNIPQDGRIAIKVSDRAIDIRVSVLPVSFGERVVMRLLDKTRSIAKLTEIGLSDRDHAVLVNAIEKPNGIVYVTGPTGSGKTTTLYSVLAQLNKPDVNIITVEDPVEYQMAGIGQVQVREKVGLTFATALRSILRQDPDIIMIGETRDQETAQIAIQASLTGHLVLSTLHTNSAPATITRLIDMNIEPFLIASSISIAVAQRLVRRLCPACKKQYSPPTDLLERLGLNAQKAASMTFFKAVGCEQCLQTGYRGRLAVFEIMEMTEELINLTMQRADTSRLRKQAQKDGMTLILQDGLRKVAQGLTSIEEVLSVAMVEHDMQA